MKKIQCSVCDGFNIISNNGEFVCQDCGIKYSASDIKKLLVEISDNDIPKPEQSNLKENEAQNLQSAKKEQLNQPNTDVKENIVVEKKTEKGLFTGTSELNQLDLGIDEELFDEDDEDDEEDIDDEIINNDNSPKKKKKKFSIKTIGFIVAIMLTGLMFLLFVTSLTSAINNIEDYSDNVFLLILGILGLIIAFILYKVLIYIERNKCPECGTKRIHHREWIDTTEKDSSRNTSYGNEYRTTYTHHYLDTYECPECGETLEVRVKKSGGAYINRDGNITDNTIPYKEF